MAAVPGVSPHAAPACGAGRMLWELRHFALRPPASRREVPLSAAAGAPAIISAGSVEIASHYAVRFLEGSKAPT